MSNVSTAASELANLLAQIPSKSEQNQTFIDVQQESFRDIDGNLFPGTGFENLDSEGILDVINQTYPGFKQEFEELFRTIDTETIGEFFNEVGNDFTEEEVLQVIEEWKQECAVRSLGQERFTQKEIVDTIRECRQQVENPIIPFSRQEVIKAACEKILEEADKQPQSAQNVNPELDEVLEEDTTEPEYSIDDLSSLKDSLDVPKNVIIIGNSLDTIEKVLVNTGDQISCNTPLFETSSGIIPAGFDEGSVEEIYAKVGDTIQNKELIYLKITSESKLEKTFTETERQVEEIQKAVSLKEQQYAAERNWYFLRIKEAWAAGRYQAYEYYFNQFDELVGQREEANDTLADLETEINEIENQIDDLFNGEGEGYLTPQQKESLIDLTNIRNNIFENIQDTVVQINNLNAQILNVRNEQYLFSPQGDDTLAEITSGEFIENPLIDQNGNPSPNSVYFSNQINGNRTNVRFFEPNEETVASYPSARSLAKGVQERIEEFSNELAIDNTLRQYMDDDDYTFTYSPEFNTLPVIIPDGDDGWTIADVISREGKRVRLNGPFHNLRVEFYFYVKNTPDSIKSKPEWNLDVKVRENQLRVNIDNLITSTVNKIREYSKQYGHIAIRFDKVFLETTSTSKLDAFRIELENIRQERQEAEDLVFQIRGGLESAEEKIQQLEENLNAIDSETCEYYKVYSSERRNDIDYKLCIWPQKPEVENPDVELIGEEINYRGNPRPLDQSPPITDLDWWKKFCELATITNLVPIYWPVGLLIPAPNGVIKIPLPVIWRPLYVIQTPLALIAIGIAQAGVLPGPWVFILNPNAFPLGPVTTNSCWFTGAPRPFRRIKSRPGSQILPVAPIVQIGQNKIDIAPSITAAIPFIKDDLPPYERLSLNNLLFILFLDKWCRAGKRSQGFFTNP